MLRATDSAYLRMVEERLELVKKVEALSDFLKKCRNNQVNNITLDEIHLLEEQFHYMNGYLRILTIRISKVQL